MARRPILLPERLAATQDGLVAHWQLLEAGMTVEAVRWWVEGQRSVHDGVYLTGTAAPTQQQRWRAATLTTPTTCLSHASAAAVWGVWRDPTWFVTVTRPGIGGPRRYDGLLIAHSTSIADHVTVRDGLPITTLGRTVVDLWPNLDGVAQRKLLREVRRRRLADAEQLLTAVALQKGRRGVALVRREIERGAALPFERCRSDAEAYALQVLDEARVPPPRVNEEFAGEEADLCWPELWLIIELDGPQWHRFMEEDARKTAAWEAAGFRVRRLPTDVLFAEPARLLALAPPGRPRRGRPPRPEVDHFQPNVNRWGF